jgi:chemotaxis protein MotB
MRARREEELNPYIAFGDLTLNLVFIMIFFLAAVLAVGQTGWEQVRFRNAQEAVRVAIEHASFSERPVLLDPKLRNDPPGAQRWAFPGRRVQMFRPGTAVLTSQGRAVLLEFARALRSEPRWRRIRVEGHTMPPFEGKQESWGLSALRAAAVADVLTREGRIPPWQLAVAGRGGQVRFNGDAGSPRDPVNERVEVVVEFAE